MAVSSSVMCWGLALPQIIARAHAPRHLVADGLVHEVPWVEDVLEGLLRHDLLLHRIQLHAEIPGFSHKGAFLGYFVVRPAKQLYNGAFLTVAVVALSARQRSRRRKMV